MVWRAAPSLAAGCAVRWRALKSDIDLIHLQESDWQKQLLFIVAGQARRGLARQLASPSRSNCARHSIASVCRALHCTVPVPGSVVSRGE